MKHDDRLNRHDVALMLGLLVCIVAFLFLISAPGALYRWFHRDGYRLVEVIVSPPAPPPSTARSVTVQLVATGEKVSIRKSSFETPLQSGRRRVLWNPRARLILGATVFDERVTPRPIASSQGLVPLITGVVLALAGLGLLRYGFVEKRPRRRKRR